MFINSSKITDIRKPIYIYNLYPFIINTVDVYFITSSAELHKALLTPDSDGNPRTILTIDDNKFPLAFNEKGESPMNPIQYTKSIHQAKFSLTERNSLTNKKITGFVGSDKINNWVPNTNIDDVDDFIKVGIEVKSIPSITSTRYGYGKSPNLVSSTNLNGTYGYGSRQSMTGNIISYGGYGNDFLFSDCAIIIENSDKIKYDYFHNDSSNILESSLINGWGEGIYGGDISSGFGE
jgi:hypothetical protein